MSPVCVCVCVCECMCVCRGLAVFCATRVWRYRGGRDGYETLQQFMAFLGRGPEEKLDVWRRGRGRERESAL